MGLYVRRRQGRRVKRDARPSRRQGRKSRRKWPVSACRFRRASRSRRRPAPIFTRTRKSFRRSSSADVKTALAHIGRLTGKAFRRQRGSASAVGAIGRARVDAGHDGYGAESWPQRRHRQGLGATTRTTSASPMIPIAVSSRCTPASCLASPTTILKTPSNITRKSKGVALDTELDAEDWRKLIVAFKAKVRRGQRQAFSARAQGAIMGRHRRRFRLMADAARNHLPAHPRHSE